jgi:hypothetical protein
VTASTGHLVLMVLPPVTGPTTLDLSSSCDTADCPLAAVVFDTDPDDSEDESDFYVFGGGTLTVTSVSGGRMRGTFSGTASEFAGGLGVTITGGTFDVPLVSESFLGASRAAAAPLRMMPD